MSKAMKKVRHKQRDRKLIHLHWPYSFWTRSYCNKKFSRGQLTEEVDKATCEECLAEKRRRLDLNANPRSGGFMRGASLTREHTGRPRDYM